MWLTILYVSLEELEGAVRGVRDAIAGFVSHVRHIFHHNRHAVLAVGGLVLAYLTWTSEEEKNNTNLHSKYTINIFDRHNTINMYN